MVEVQRPVDLQDTLESASGYGVDRSDGRNDHLFSSSSSQDETTKPKLVKLRIWTMDQHRYLLQFNTGSRTTAGQILTEMIHELGLPADSAGNYFSIWLTSPHLQLQLKPHHYPCRLFKKWKEFLTLYTTCDFDQIHSDEPILSFQRNAFLKLKDERKILDAKVIDLLYEEAKFNVLRGRYPMRSEDYVSLAGLQAAIHEGLMSDNEHYNQPVQFPVEEVPCIFSHRYQLREYFPVHMMKGGAKGMIAKLFRSSSQPNLEAQLSVAHREASKNTPERVHLQQRYLQLCRSMSFYGSVFFKGQIERRSATSPASLLGYSDRPVVVAINTEAIHIISSDSPSEVMLFLPYDQMSWCFIECQEEGDSCFSSLMIEFDSVLHQPDNTEQKVVKRLQVFSRQAPMMDAMITRCVDELNHHEEELRKLRVEQTGAENLPVCSITSNKQGEPVRKQKQLLNHKEEKLMCEVRTPEGEVYPQRRGSFTLSRPFKKKEPRKQRSEETAAPLMSTTLDSGQSMTTPM